MCYNIIQIKRPGIGLRRVPAILIISTSLTQRQFGGIWGFLRSSRVATGKCQDSQEETGTSWLKI